MSAGTLTLTNNSAAVTGSGTAFTTELAAGDFIVVTVGGIPYTLAIKTVNSNTSLTLVSSYTGPTQAGAAWYAVPRVAMNLVTAALVAQSAEALRGLNYDKQNWQSIFSGTGNVTVTLPDGSSFTGPAWNSFTTALNGKADKVSGAVPVNQGGTGATTVESARSNLGLRSAALADVLGTVSQTGGVPTGAVIEKGANSNGEYVRFADGTQICRMAVAAADAVNKNVTTAGSLGGYRSSQNPVPFPANFAAPAYCSGHINNNGHNVRIEFVSGSQASCQFAFHAVNSGTYSGADTIYITAIGRWF
ncbi:hypothetical protein [Enterobacter cloacae]|uniref:hypothetical protein n=1 Tax=Enterobacter cloacae TaxID=550 RepID=UPI002877D8B2|nr:hypothetical protein [Enterobacter cloacae]